MQALLDKVQELYWAGLYLQALEASRPLGPPQSWRGPRGRVMATRLVSRLGGVRLADILMWKAFREFPHDGYVRYFRAYRIGSRKGPLALLRFYESLDGMDDAPVNFRADWNAAVARTYASLRDFDAAQASIERALELAPKRAWLWVENARVLVAMDRREDALASVDKALGLRPWYEMAVDAKVDLLGELNRDDEALTLVTECAERLESGGMLWSKALLLTEARRYEEARETFERCRDYFPLSDKRHAMWLDARRSDAAYRCGDYATALRLAKGVRGGFYKLLAENLENATADARRVELDVPFVRQHHVTCSPATLASLCGYWKAPADHVELAETICYDGTPNHSERNWAEQRGFVVREFTLDWATAVALVDRGIPFGVETRGPTYAHIQPIIGYDARRGTLLTRDPGERLATEMMAQPLFEEMAAFGPRAVALVPAAEAGRLDGIELPDAKWFDEVYELQRALLKHDRERAAAIFARLERDAPEHRLTLHARRTLAYYDGDHVAALACIEAQLAQYPDNHTLALNRVQTLGQLGRHAEQLRDLEAACAKLPCPAVFWRNLGRELSTDFRRVREARTWLARSLRYLRTDAYAYFSLACVEWDLGQREEATRLYRIAACLEDKDEQYARSYFIASRHLKRVDETLAWLRRRFDLYGHKSAGPGVTLAGALFELDRDVEALEVIEQAVAKRGDDGWLLTYAATKYAYAERWDEADAVLERARGAAHRGAWLRSAARIAEARGELTTALGHWQALAEVDPLDSDTHERIVDLLRATADEQRAVDYMRGVAAAHPHHLNIQRSLLVALHNVDAAEAESVARRALELHPQDGWTRRELVDALAMLGRTEEALAEADAAVAIDSTSPASYGYRGKLLFSVGRVEEAREDFRQALRISVDYEYAFDALCDLCQTDAQRRDVLAWHYDELVRQTTFGDGLTAYYRRAKAVLDAETLLSHLQSALAARPDLWQAWCVVAVQLRRMERTDEARGIAEEATRRFPLAPRTWLDLALMYDDAADVSKRIEALRKAHALSPGWSLAAQELAETLEKSGDLEGAEQTLAQVLRRSPSEIYARGSLAELYYRTDRKERALGEIKRACRTSPSYDWGWEKARQWFGELDRAAELVELGRELVAVRPGDCVACYRLAECLGDQRSAAGEDADALRSEALAALDRAVSLDPTYVDAHAERVYHLYEADRLDEALAAARPAAWPAEDRPIWLRTWEARVIAKQGDMAAAIDLLRGVVDDAPHYTWAWGIYLKLLEDVELHAECRAAAEKAVDLNPDYEVGCGYLGDACWELNDLDAAARAYERSLEASSDYVYGASQLVRLQLQRRDGDAAAAALEELRRRDSGPWPLELGVYVDVLRHGHRAKLDDLALLAKSQAAQSFRELAEYLKGSSVRATAERLLRPLVADVETNPHAGVAWAILAGPRWSTILRLSNMGRETAAWQAAGGELAKQLAGAKAGGKLRWAMRSMGDRLRRDDHSWGQVGYALNVMNRYRACWKWMRDWRRRDGVEPWALFNALQGAWRVRAYDDVLAIGEAALALPADHSRSLHLVWHAAAVLVLRRDHARAGKLLAEADRSQCKKSNAAVWDVIEPCIAALGESPPVDRRRAKELVRAQRAAVAKRRYLIHRDPELRQIAYRALHLVAEHLGREWLARWYRLRRAI